jgi:hypothetical protein
MASVDMYLPKTKYKGNQLTLDGSVIDVQTEELYTGPFFETSTGEIYTGAAPSATSRRLVRVEGSGPGIDQTEKEVYDYLRENNTELRLKDTLPLPIYYPKPGATERFTRYFAVDKKTQRILEINKNDYLSIKNQEVKYYFPRYELRALEWSLTDIVSNKRNISINGLDSYLKDPSQFVR